MSELWVRGRAGPAACRLPPLRASLSRSPRMAVRLLPRPPRAEVAVGLRRGLGGRVLAVLNPFSLNECRSYCMSAVIDLEQPEEPDLDVVRCKAQEARDALERALELLRK